MTKYIALSLASCFMMQVAALADEVRSSTTEIQEPGQTSTSSSVTKENDMGSSSASCTKTIKSAAPSRVIKKQSDSYSNNGVVQQKETKVETDLNP